MTGSSRVLRGVIAIALAIGMVPGVSWAVENQPTDGTDVEASALSQSEETQPAETPIVPEEAEEKSTDTADVRSVEEETERASEEGIQPLDGVQEGPQVLEEGDFGENNALHWVYKDDASLTISGNGAIPDYAEDGGQPWNAYMELVETVQIEEGISRIGAYSFYSFNLITEICFPETLESIGAYALAKMTRLASIELPDSVTELGEGTFHTCQGLKTCHLSESIGQLPKNLFYRCNNLEEVNIPLAAESIESYAFWRWRSDVNVPLKSPTFPPNLKSLEQSAFVDISLSGDLVIPNTLSDAVYRAFSSVSIEGDVIFEEGCSSKAYGMWIWSNADRVHIPQSSKTIPNVNARYEYIVNENNSLMCAIDGCLYSGQSIAGSKIQKLSRIPTRYKGELIIPEGTETTDGDGGGYMSEGITRVQLPSTMKSLPNPGTTFVGKSVTAIDVSPDNPYFTSIDGALFTKDEETILRFPLAHPQQQYRIPASVKNIGTGSGWGPFSCCSNLKSVIFPDGVEKIRDSDLYFCSSLVSIYIPNTVTSISTNNLNQSGRTGVTIFYEGTKDEWEKVETGQPTYGFLKDPVIYCDVSDQGINDDGMLFYIDHDRTLNVVPDEKAKTISYVIKDISSGVAAWSAFKSDFDKVKFSNAITTIGANAFKDCENITSVMIPSSVTAVRSGAFAGCSSLHEVQCLGNGFEVVSATAENPSFDDQTVTLFYQGGATGWIDSPAYDPATSRWHGYHLVQGEQAVLPSVGRIIFTDGETEITETQMTTIAWEVKSFKITVLSTEGEDITKKVAISITAPERERPITAQAKRMYNRDELYQVSFLAGTSELSVGGATAPGVYSVEALPIQGETAGDPLTVPFNVTREAERIFWCTGDVGNQPTVTLIGNRASEKTTTYRYDVWNQYGESVWDQCDIRFIDKLSGTDVTGQDAKTGLSLDRRSENLISISQLAVPRDYGVKFLLDSEGRHSEFTGNLYIKRDIKLLNDPWDLTLSGGDDEIYPQEHDSWSSVPYRVRVRDCYEDPCWPELGWNISKADGEDVHAHFELDKQGYLKIKASVQNLVNAGEISFNICSTTTGHDYQGSSSTDALRRSNVLTFVVKVKQPDPEPVTHTATFKVGEDVIGQVVFEEGDTSLEEPALPIRENYIGEWEEYDLAGQTSDFVVQGVYSPMDPDKVSEVAGGVDAEYDNGLVNISISAAAATKNIKVESNNTKPLDAVMVLDRSGSMNDDNKLEKLKQCAEQFAQSLYENAEKTGADHRIALVGFAYGNVSSGSYNRSGYENSGLLTTASGSARTFQEICSQECSDALLPINNGGAINGNIINAINTMTANGATAADVGLDIARRVFADSPDRIDANGNVRERVAIFITDGVPTSFYATDYRQVTETAAQAITMANVIKQGQGARIYSIGVDANASAEAAFNSAADGAITRGSGSNRTVQSYDFNRFLHAVSSNYPNAAAMSNLGDGDKAAGYYMAANDTSSLDKIFTNILYSTVYSIQSFDRATLTYKLPAGLVLTMKDEEAMRASLAQQGMLDEDIEVVRDGDSTTLVFRNVKVKREAVNGINQYAARVSFQVSVDGGVSGEVLAGAGASAEIGGQATDIEVPTVNIPADRRLIVFKINGEVYEIRNAQVGDAITLPETDIARWLDLEKQENPVVKEGDAYVVFETSTLERAYTMKWIANGTVVTETHAFGEELSIPSGIGSAVPEGMEISHWSPSLPQTMPARNATCTAVLTPVHVHAYQADSYTTGSCTEGLTIHQVCSCGEEQTSQNAPKDHAYKAYLSSAGQYSTTVEKLVCEDCGHSVSKNITYQVSKSSRWPNLVVLELDKYENEVLQSGPSDDDITIRFYVGDEMDGTYNVYRIDENGVQDTFKGTVENGYLSFAPDHFSDYVIGPISESGEDDAPTYEQVKDIKANPDLPAMDPDDEENAGNDDGNNGDGDNENNGSNNGDDNNDNPDDNNDNPDDNANTNDGNGNNSNNGQDTSDNNDALKENDPENRGDGTIAQPEEVDPADSLPTEYGAPLRPTQLESVLADTGDDQVQWIWCLSCVALLAVALVGFLGVRRLRRMKR